MTDREKVIKGLEELRDHLFHEYNVCYHGDEEDVYRRFLVVDDALALIREQQPKVICFNEIDNYEVLWLEVKGVNTEAGLVPWVKTQNGRWFSPLICGKSQPEMELATEKEYGSIARCWTARPTDEQRKMVKWEQQKAVKWEWA